MKITEHYNIHDLIKFQIRKEKKGLFWNLNPEYEYFRVERVDDPNIIVNVGKFKPSLNGAYLVDGRYFVKENYIFRGGELYDVEITGLEMEEPFVVNIFPKPRGIRKLWPILAVQDIFLRPLVEIKAVNMRYLILHAAGISDGDYGYIFAGRGGSGKTTLIMNLISQGYKYLGEERIIIKDNIAYSYPLNLKLIDFWIKNMKDETSFPFMYRLRALLSIISNKKTSINIENTVKTKNFFIIAKKRGLKKLSCRRVNMEKLSKMLVYNNMIDMMYGYMPFITGVTKFDFTTLLQSYLYIYPNSKIGKHWDTMRDLCEKYLENVDTYLLTIPESLDSHIYNEVIHSVLGG